MVVSHFGTKVHILHQLKSTMAAFNSEFLPQAKLFLLLALMRSRSQKINRVKYRFWVSEIFKCRHKFGAYNTLVQAMHLHDREYFYRYDLTNLMLLFIVTVYAV